jgi:hypothetical protein
MPFADPNAKRRWSRDYYLREKERVLGIKRRWAERNPEKRAAHIAVGNAVRDGRLVKLPCEVCGAKAQAHHDDYSKPLEVRWLCPPHHAEERRK